MRPLHILTLTLFVGGCAQVIGLEERTLSSSAADGGSEGGMPVAAGCAKYCADAKELCTNALPDGKQVALFDSEPTCLAVCSQYPTGPELMGNTLACRQNRLDNLRDVGAAEANTYCPPAGPGGGVLMGESPAFSCGDDCASYCLLRSKICPEDQESDCEAKCRALPVAPKRFNGLPGAQGGDFTGGIDTLQCRTAHLSAAALYFQRGQPDDRKNHCGHSGITSTGPCDLAEQAPSCADICKIVAVACSGGMAAFENPLQCMSFCEGLEKGTPMEKSKPGTARCMREGAYAALEALPSDKARMCAKAGPAADGCGIHRCDSYCLLSKKACPTEFAAEFGAEPAGDAACQTKCRPLSGTTFGEPYVADASMATGIGLQCRLLRLARAFERPDSNTCRAAVGAPGTVCASM